MRLRTYSFTPQVLRRSRTTPTGPAILEGVKRDHVLHKTRGRDLNIHTRLPTTVRRSAARPPETLPLINPTPQLVIPFCA